jgi:lysyl endopeptidase
VSTARRGFFLYLFFLLLFSTRAISIMRETPRSFTAGGKALSEVDIKETGCDNSMDLKKSSTAAGEPAVHLKLKPFIFAIPIDVDWTPGNSGTWEVLADGSKLWRLRILSRKAKSLNLGITDFFLPPCVKLWLYNFNADYVEGPYEDKDKTNNQLWTPVIPGEQMVVEIYVPAGIFYKLIRVGITKVNHGFSGVEQRGPCNVDVACPGAGKWRDQIRSAALFSWEGHMRCTGVLLNNCKRNFTPYLLTAAHSGINCSNAHTMVIYWNYQSPNCARCRCENLAGSLAYNQTGAIFRAKWNDEEGSDFVLVELKERPDPQYNVYYSGWDATGTNPGSAFGIHHPADYEKSVNFCGSTIISTGKKSMKTNAGGYYWCVDKWDFGTIQDGSSGSGLWDASTGLCIGQLWGGYGRGCDEKDPCQPKEGSCWYGKFSAAWEGGGTPGTHLKYWLDPCDTGTKILPGADPLCPPTPAASPPFERRR